MPTEEELKNTYDVGTIVTPTLGRTPTQQELTSLEQFKGENPDQFTNPALGVSALQKQAVSMLSTDSARETLDQKLGYLNEVTSMPAKTQTTGEQAPQQPETKTPGDSYSFEEAIQLWGKDFTGLTRTEDGRYVPDASALERLGIAGLQDGSTSREGQLSEEVSKLDAQLDDFTQQMLTYNVDKDPAFQAQVQAIQERFGAIRREMEEVNKQRAATLKTMGYRTGSQQYTGAIQMGIEGEELKQANERISEINRQEVEAINAARAAMKTGNYEEFNAKINAIEKVRQRKSEELAGYAQKLAAAQEAAREQAKFEFEVLKWQKELNDKGKTDLIREFEFAQNNGFQGDMFDYQTARENAKLSDFDRQQKALSIQKQIAEIEAMPMEAAIKQAQLATLQKELAAVETRSVGDTLVQKDPETGQWVEVYSGNATGGMTPEQKSDFLSISTRYQADGVISNAVTARQAQNIANQIEKNPAQAGTQISLLYSYIKLLDPTSAVREGEIGLANQTQSYFQSWKKELERVSTGKALSDKSALELARATKELADQWFTVAERRENQFTSQANVAGVGDAWEKYKSGFDELYSPSQTQVFEDFYTNSTASQKQNIQAQLMDPDFGATIDERRQNIMEFYGMTPTFNQGRGGTPTAPTGSLSEKFESGGNPGAIGRDTTGGWSYGSYQLAHNNAKRFIEQSQYAKDFQGLTFNSEPWRRKWQEVAKRDPQGFGAAQRDFIRSTHFDPQVQKLQSTGVDIGSFSPVLQDVIWSTAVQHGPNNNIILDAVRAVGKNAPESALIKEIYKRRWAGGRNFASSTEQVKKSVYNRFFGKNGEMNQALQMIG